MFIGSFEWYGLVQADTISVILAKSIRIDWIFFTFPEIYSHKQSIGCISIDI